MFLYYHSSWYQVTVNQKRCVRLFLKGCSLYVVDVYPNLPECCRHILQQLGLHTAWGEKLTPHWQTQRHRKWPPCCSEACDMTSTADQVESSNSFANTKARQCKSRGEQVTQQFRFVTFMYKGHHTPLFRGCNESISIN